MYTVCPKCSYERQATDQAPDWQCPSCGLAYVKMARAAAGAAAASSGAGVQQAQVPAGPSSPIPWRKLTVIAVVLWGVLAGIQVNRSRHGGISNIGASITGDVSPEQLAALAATVKPGDVVMYTLTDCPYCAEAKGWLHQYGFAYTECDVQAREECAAQLQQLGGDGTPYLIVKGRRLSGFDSDEFLDALKKGSSG